MNYEKLFEDGGEGILISGIDGLFKTILSENKYKKSEKLRKVSTKKIIKYISRKINNTEVGFEPSESSILTVSEQAISEELYENIELVFGIIDLFIEDNISEVLNPRIRSILNNINRTVIYITICAAQNILIKMLDRVYETSIRLSMESILSMAKDFYRDQDDLDGGSSQPIEQPINEVLSLDVEF